MGLIVGQLLLPNGEPMVRARVHFAVRDAGGMLGGTGVTLEADSLGRYSWEIEPGEYQVSISYWPERGPIVRRRPLGVVTVTEQSATLNQLLTNTVPDYPVWLDLDFASEQYEVMNARVPLSEIVAFTRASGGGRFNAQGQYEWLGNDEPRIDYDPLTGECLGLLVEEARTNLLLHSEDLTKPVWKLNATIVTPDGDIAGMPAFSVAKADSNAYRSVYQTVSGAVVGTTIYATCVVAAGSNSQVSMTVIAGTTDTRVVFDFGAGDYFNASSGNTPAESVLIEPGPTSETYRVGIAVVAAGTTVQMYIYPGNLQQSGETDSIRLTAPQLEMGAFPSSYIPTEGAPVTRAADIATVENLAPWYSPIEGCVLVDCTPRFPYVSKGLVSFYSSKTNRLTVFRQHTTNEVKWYNAPGSPDRGGVVPVANGLPAKIAVTWTADGSRAISTNGSQPSASQVSGGPDFSAMTTLGLMHSFGPAGELSGGHIRQLRYYPAALPASELETLTATE